MRSLREVVKYMLSRLKGDPSPMKRSAAVAKSHCGKQERERERELT
jgi:hypothetical protein